ncbi:hypothetical protein [Marinicella gelatinilytica]|uniref:hypothetical protein n=1 Tax=Marinicella gelatinilytica TaxID=2996017 RepID=UPI002260841A|nr:hypothetical protein [Marinicella gelatinilytica]MCX7544509.1 hypothetical protein [Marinicella gelatinilytica]
MKPPEEENHLRYLSYVLMGATLVAVVYLLNYQYYTLQFPMISFFNSDGLYLPDLSQDLLNNGFVEIFSWNFSRAPGLVELLFFLPINYFFESFKSISIFFTFKIIITFILMYRLYCFKYSRNTSAIYSSISIMLLGTILLHDVSSPHFMVLIPAHHYFDFLFTLISGVFVLCYKNMKQSNLIWFFFVCLIAGINDQLYYLHFVIPALLYVCLQTFLYRKNLKKNIILGVVIILASCLAYYFSKLILDPQIHTTKVSFAFGLTQVIEDFSFLFRQIRITMNSVTLLAVVCFYSYCFYSIIIRNNDRSWAILLLLSLFVTLTVLMLSPSSVMNIRYFLPYLYIPVLFIFYMIPEFKSKRFEWFLTIILVAIIALNLISLRPKAFVSEYYPAAVECVDDFAEDEGVYSFITDYWKSRRFTFLSKNKISAIHFNKNFKQRNIVTNRNRIEPSFSAVLVYGSKNRSKRATKLNASDVEKVLGPPLKMKTCGELDIMLYPKNSIKFHKKSRGLLYDFNN